ARSRPVVHADDILKVADDIAQQFRPHQIVLFGSYAYGDPAADSDADLLVVTPYRGHSHRTATQIRMLIQARFPIDLLVRSPDEVRRRVRQGDFFLEESTEE